MRFPHFGIVSLLWPAASTLILAPNGGWRFGKIWLLFLGNWLYHFHYSITIYNLCFFLIILNICLGDFIHRHVMTVFEISVFIRQASRLNSKNNFNRFCYHQVKKNESGAPFTGSGRISQSWRAWPLSMQ